MRKTLYCNGCFISPTQTATGRWVWVVVSAEGDILEKEVGVNISLVERTLEDLEGKVEPV